MKLCIGIDPVSLASAVTNTVVMFTPVGYRMTVVHVHPMAYDAGLWVVHDTRLLPCTRGIGGADNLRKRKVWDPIAAGTLTTLSCCTGRVFWSAQLLTKRHGSAFPNPGRWSADARNVVTAVIPVEHCRGSPHVVY